MDKFWQLSTYPQNISFYPHKYPHGLTVYTNMDYWLFLWSLTIKMKSHKLINTLYYY